MTFTSGEVIETGDNLESLPGGDLIRRSVDDLDAGRESLLLSRAASATIGAIAEPPGALRLIDPSLTTPPGTAPPPAAACQEHETQISWNQKGPAGLAGGPGPQGPRGESGGGEGTFSLLNRSGPTFLKLDGIAGTAKDKKHKDWIEVESWSFGVAMQGGGGGKPVNSLTIRKSIERARRQGQQTSTPR